MSKTLFGFRYSFQKWGGKKEETPRGSVCSAETTEEARTIAKAHVAAIGEKENAQCLLLELYHAQNGRLA